MINIKPRTYNEIMRLTRCMKIKDYVPTLTDENIEEMYHFLSENPQNKISLTSQAIAYVNESGETVNAIVIDSPTGSSKFSCDEIILGTTTFHIVNSQNTSGSDSSGGCSGCSSNNNNNNNNNNG